VVCQDSSRVLNPLYKDFQGYWTYPTLLSLRKFYLLRGYIVNMVTLPLFDVLMDHFPLFKSIFIFIFQIDHYTHQLHSDLCTNNST